MKKILLKIICLFLGHDVVSEGIFENERSKWGAYRCLRCDKIHDWQYDNPT
jgi:hypothetical protein